METAGAGMGLRLAVLTGKFKAVQRTCPILRLHPMHHRHQMRVWTAMATAGVGMEPRPAVLMFKIKAVELPMQRAPLIHHRVCRMPVWMMTVMVGAGTAARLAVLLNLVRRWFWNP